jgi:protein O-GlcNAc transferase
VMLLASGVFENHDRSRFEVTAISTGGDDDSALRQRLLSAFDRFIDVPNRSAREIAELMRNLEIDIAVDLMGHTQNAPTAIFANRPAPIQVNFLGFPGTSAAPYMDYIIADQIVIDEQRQSWFGEKITWLPQSCLPNDNARPIGARVTRSDAGLPERGFVFCNFGKPHKITPEIFAAWMRLLSQTPDSVLWLASTSEIARQNLRREAAKHGVDDGRLLFARFVDSPEDHLARIGLADLFLDTFPYNAHATACDFLWAGVPVLTLTGGGFAGRVGASVLSAAGLGALITDSLDAYELVALNLAHDAAAMQSVKDDLARNRMECALFDTVRFTRNLEQAFTIMWQRHESGQSPSSFAVEEDHD